MPRGDRTGPMGMGSMTGRAAGYCAGYAAPGYATPFMGRGGFGYGRGGGRGRGWFGRGFGRGWDMGAYPYAGGYAYSAPYPPAEIAPKEEAEMLKEQAKMMREEINAINQRIKDLESSQKTKK